MYSLCLIASRRDIDAIHMDVIENCLLENPSFLSRLISENRVPLPFLLSVVLMQFVLADPRNAFLFFDDLLDKILLGLLLLNFEI